MENQKDKTVIWQSVLDIIEQNTTQISFETWFKPLRIRKTGVQHLLHLKSKSKILQPIEIMGFFYEISCQIQGNNLL